MFVLIAEGECASMLLHALSMCFKLMFKVEVLMFNKNTIKEKICDFFLATGVGYKIVITMFIVVMIFIFVIFYIPGFNINDTKINKIYCSAVLEIHKDEFYSQVKMTYSIHGDYGLAFIDGHIYKNGSVIGFVSQRTSFDVKEINDILLLTSNDTWATEVHNMDEQLFTGVLPLFYTQKGNYVTIRFTQKSPNHYDVSTKVIPSMHCSIIEPRNIIK
ncbi:hypothetical protein [Yersinia enterocolitica]|uniref:hypothetical protein n=1 Tax=Yersinia enterocolitica TaxID=630 RepID=UPI001115857F|nr:hypothetical protein [Yersinia enterocolitica]ELI7922724.1 hypothetical protein [Yersinia enterocolitica]